MTSMTEKIELNNVEKVYETAAGRLDVLRRVNFTVRTGEFVCLLGPSGCGKSTLLRIVAGITSPNAGEVLIHRASTNGRPSNAMVFQEYALFPWRTVLKNVAFGQEMQGTTRQERLNIARHYVEKVGLTRFVDHYPHQLSGGMKQRVAIARALANNPEVLLMDEPFGALDAQTRTLLQEELLRIWEEEHKTVVYVTHSIEEAVLLSDRVILLTARPGQIKRIYPVPLPRPRDLSMRTTVEFTRLEQMMWVDLKEEVNKARQAEGSVL